MAYCGPKGIPLSVFLSWREDDQQAALAWQTWDATRCKGCGTHSEDWDPEQAGSRDAYRAEATVCQGCVELQRLRDSPEIQSGIRGVHLGLRRNVT